MPAEIRQPLAVLFTLPDGVIHQGSLHDLPDKQLAADLAVGLVASTHPHGPIRTRSVARHYMTTMRRMARDLGDWGVTGGLADLSPGTLVQYWLTCDYHRERRIRVVLSAFQETAGDWIRASAATSPGGGSTRPGRASPTGPTATASGGGLKLPAPVDRGGAPRPPAGARGSRRGADPALHGVTFDNLAWLRLRAGPAEARRVAERLDTRHAGVDRAQVVAVEAALFPATDTAFAYLTLFAMRTGIVLDGIDALKLDDITRASANTVLLSYRKGRTGGEVLNLPRDAVQLLDRWLEHGAAARACR